VALIEVNLKDFGMKLREKLRAEYLQQSEIMADIRAHHGMPITIMEWKRKSTS
jgi:hypothetical protein